jgi:hypothetical protein
MNKAELWAQAQIILGAHKASKELSAELEELLKPKSGGSSINPPKLNANGEIIEAWCKFHQRYELVKDIVLSNGKPKGYCKAGISLWNKTNSDIKKIESKAVEFMSEGKFEEAQKEAQKAKELKDKYNSPEFYDYDRDWSSFLA